MRRAGRCLEIEVKQVLEADFLRSGGDRDAGDLSHNGLPESLASQIGVQVARQTSVVFTLNRMRNIAGEGCFLQGRRRE